MRFGVQVEGCKLKSQAFASPASFFRVQGLRVEVLNVSGRSNFWGKNLTTFAKSLYNNIVPSHKITSIAPL